MTPDIENLLKKIDSLDFPNKSKKDRNVFLKSLEKNKEITDEIFLKILMVIKTAHGFYCGSLPLISENHQPDDLKWYWNERQKLETAIESIFKNDLVKLSNQPIEFYEPDEWICPHSRRRKKCEESFTKIKILINFQTGNYVPISLWSLLGEIYKEMKKLNIDNPLDAKQSDFCSPAHHETYGKVPAVIPQFPSGALPKLLKNYIVEKVVGCLIASLSVAKSCEIASEILYYFFGEMSDSDSISRQFRRLKSQPKPWTDPPEIWT